MIWDSSENTVSMIWYNIQNCDSKWYSSKLEGTCFNISLQKPLSTSPQLSMANQWRKNWMRSEFSCNFLLSFITAWPLCVHCKASILIQIMHIMFLPPFQRNISVNIEFRYEVWNFVYQIIIVILAVKLKHSPIPFRIL